MKRLVKAVAQNKEKDLQKNLHQFKTLNKLKKEDFKDKSKTNPMYKRWQDHVNQFYPQYAYDPNYITRGWGYITGPFWWGGGDYGYSNPSNDNDNDNSSDDGSSGDSGSGGDSGGGGE